MAWTRHRNFETEPTHDDRASIAELFTQLKGDARAYVNAQIALYRTEAGRRASTAGLAAGLLLGALTLVFGAVIALLVGTMLVLAPLLGTGWAVTLVTFGSLAIAGLLAWLGIRQVKATISPDKTS